VVETYSVINFVLMIQDIIIIINLILSM